MTSSLVLGTAQFGQKYGATNGENFVSLASAREILSLAKKFNINKIDTAPTYGQAEKILSKLQLQGYDITTKFEFEKTKDWSNFLDALILEKRLLNQNKFKNLLTHNPDYILETSAYNINKAFDNLKNNEICEHVGVTVYTCQQLDKILRDKINCDVIQVPANLLDRRFSENKNIEKLRSKGVLIQARSIFLQGLIVSDFLPKKFMRFNVYFNNIKKLSLKTSKTPMELTFQYLNSVGTFDEYLVGALNVEQLTEIIHSHRICLSTNHRGLTSFDELSCEEINLIDPAQWKGFN